MNENNKYTDLLEISKERTSNNYENVVYFHDETKSVIATNGYRMLARRDIYTEMKVLARLSQKDSTALIYNQDSLWVPHDTYTPRFSLIIPSDKDLKSNHTKTKLMMPKWLASLPKEENEIYMSLMNLNENPILAVGLGYENSSGINSKFLRPFIGKNVDFYIPKKNDAPYIILPQGKDLESCEWFSLIMPAISVEDFCPIKRG